MPELDLIRQFRATAPAHPWLTVGPGHDCAILRWQPERDVALKIDQVIEGTHFELAGPYAATPSRVGWKAMAKACSDLAAVGFWPVAATAALNLRKGTPDRLASEVYEGLTACCRQYHFALAGGDVSTSTNGLSIAVSLVGEGPRDKAWLRSGAQVGDELFVTGSLGGSRASKHLHFLPRLEEARLIRQIIPEGVHACIDITDGLARDLHHLCEESRCGALIAADRIPLSADTLEFASGKRGRDPLQQALEDGEDFELLLAVEPQSVELLKARWTHATPLVAVGRILSQSEGCLMENRQGQRQVLPNVGYEHRT